MEYAMRRIGLTRRGCLFIGVVLCAATAFGAKSWRTYENCKLIPNPFNDGDSFHVKAGKRHYIFRLYFVDCPETDMQIPERVTDQAAYWDIDEDRAMELGKEAKEFTREFLKKGFTVHTRMEDARGNSKMSREFAMIEVGDTFLSEALVENGLARIYGNRNKLPDGRSDRKYLAVLARAEREAKRKRLGGWREAGKAIRVSQIEPHERVTTQAVSIYSLSSTSQLVGVLPKGTKVAVLEALSPFMVRVRFMRDGRIYEAKCRRWDLGIKDKP